MTRFGHVFNPSCDRQDRTLPYASRRSKERPSAFAGKDLKRDEGRPLTSEDKETNMKSSNLSNPQGVSRRDFLKAGGIIGGSLAVAGLAGCASGSAEPASDGGSDIAWDKEADVVVVGSGVAGMTAAVEALEGGASVVVIEREAQMGGASSGCGTFTAWGSSLPVEGPVEDSADLFYEDLMRASGNTADPALLRVVADDSYDAVDFLSAHGVAFASDYRLTEGRNGQITYRYESVGGAVLGLKDAFDGLGGELLTATPLTELVRNAEGRCIGVRAGDGMSIKANKAVVMATGSWIHDEVMVKSEWPNISPEMFDAAVLTGSFGMPFGLHTGEGIRIAQKAGAGVRHLNYLACSPYFSTSEYSSKDVAGAGLTRESDELFINLEGKRFTDESQARGIVAEEIAKQTKGQYLSIVDSKFIPLRLMPVCAPEGVLDSYIENGYVACADTYEDLASQIEGIWGVPADAILQTLNDYKAACEQGVDPEFGKPAPFLTPLVDPPYYAGPTMETQIDIALGGLSTNAQAQVLDVDGVEIPGLYAAGVCTGGHLGKASFMGCYQMDAVVYGRLAGQNAAAQENWE